MPKLHVEAARNALQNFEFKRLFIEELGWSNPANPRPVTQTMKEIAFTRAAIAELSGAVVFEITMPDGEIPDRKTRETLAKELQALHFEHVLIFVDARRSASVWFWLKKQDGKTLPRQHEFIKGQPGDLFISKISALVFDLSDLDDEGNVSIVEVANRLRNALDIERVTKQFYRDYQAEYLRFCEVIQGIENERDRRWYASILLNRLMFIYFLQRKLFLDNGSEQYLSAKLTQSQQQFGADQYYARFLKPLFFDGFGKAENERSAEVRALIGKIVYLNGGLFLPHRIEDQYPAIQIADAAFTQLFDLFNRYSWTLDDTPGGSDNEINPDVLGYIFEKYINQKEFGAYYTRREITEYLCEQTIYKLILDAVNTPDLPDVKVGGKTQNWSINFASVPELLLNLDAYLCKRLLAALEQLSLIDPACGSGAFLVAAMKTLINVYSAVIGKIDFLTDPALTAKKKAMLANHPSIQYYIKKQIITNNLYGVDIMEEAAEIAKLRLFLALVASAQTVNDLEPLPNIDFNILPGNSLIGLMRVDDVDFDKRYMQGDMFRKTYQQILNEKAAAIRSYKDQKVFGDQLKGLRDSIDRQRNEAIDALNDILLDEFANTLKIKYEQATWDSAKQKEGKPVKRALRKDDIATLRPFHWSFEFDEIFRKKNGFDAIITNPPWEIFKPQAKEFFAEYSDLVTKNKMDIKTFEKEQEKLLQTPEIAAAWCEYQSRYPHVSAYFRSAAQYKNQIAVVNGKKAGTDINLYKLFTEQCFNLLRPGGYCGIVIPSGIYTDLGTKQLRQMLFDDTTITGLFCFENRKEIFENVHRSFKFVVLSFEKLGKTDTFPAAFMRHDPAELDHFPNDESVNLSVDLIKKLSPDSLSIMEFKDEIDIQIAEKISRFPSLGETIEGTWNVQLTREFDMTNDSYLFRAEPKEGAFPLYEGKMIHQFSHQLAKPRYWVNEKEGRKALIKRGEKDEGQILDYQCYRLGFRDVARNTDYRTMISTVMQSHIFAGNTLIVSKPFDKLSELICCSALLNSFVCDYAIRQKVTAHCNMFYVYQLPIPRLTAEDVRFNAIVARAARLVCTTPEFAELWNAVMASSRTRNTRINPGDGGTDGGVLSTPGFIRGDDGTDGGVPPAPGFIRGDDGTDGGVPPAPGFIRGDDGTDGGVPPAPGFIRGDDGTGGGVPSAPGFIRGDDGTDGGVPPAPGFIRGDDGTDGGVPPAPGFIRGAGWTPECGATDEAERSRLRAELDGMIAQIYGLTYDEFAYILTTFPLVPQAQKDAALQCFHHPPTPLLN